MSSALIQAAQASSIGALIVVSIEMCLAAAFERWSEATDTAPSGTLSRRPRSLGIPILEASPTGLLHFGRQ